MYTGRESVGAQGLQRFLMFLSSLQMGFVLRQVGF